MLTKNHYMKFALGALLLPGLLGFETAIAQMPKEVENPLQVKEESLVQGFQNIDTQKQKKVYRRYKVYRRCFIVRQRVGNRIITRWRCITYRR